MTSEEMTGADAPPDVPRTAWRSRSLYVLACGLCGVLLYLAQAAFIPIALALLFALVLSSPVRHSIVAACLEVSAPF